LARAEQMVLKRGQRDQRVLHRLVCDCNGHGAL
jgi:hypothetical protein